jgi:predicted RNase H-like nuclease (RuvC/YqgF family)
MNKKIALSIVLIAIIALALATWFVHNQISDLQNQISELQNQNSELQDQNTDLQDQLSELQNQKTELQDQLSELQNQLSELQNKTDIARDVKITDFEWIGGYHHLGQVNLFQNFKVTIENMGDNNVSGLTLSVKLLSVGTNAEIDEYTKQIDIVRAGQIVEISGFVSVGVIGSYAHTAVGVITLSLGDVLLDQWTRNLEGSF